MQKESKKQKSFKLIFFENESEEIYDIFQAKKMLGNGNEITAVGYININNSEMLVRTSRINEILIFKKFAKILTNNMEYIMEISTFSV